jgi:6-phosphogluconate dehydrogenase
MTTPTCDLGVVGLGVMGRNLLLNMADHGYAVAGYDKDVSKVQALQQAAGRRDLRGVQSLVEFVACLRPPRAVMLLVPAGAPVDGVLRDLQPHLRSGDLLIDAGNSYFKDTDRRSRTLSEKGIHFFGMGISGGEAGARHGPSMMPGGPVDAYARLRPVLEAAAAQVDGEPCVAYLGSGSAGHFVKMVHNGIEYGDMQLIAETYDLMKRGLGLGNDQLRDVYQEWNQGVLQSYLLEITGDIFRQQDASTGKRLIDVILDEAKQLGTGMWTSQNAMELQVPTPTIDSAVAMRNLSADKAERETASRALPGPPAAWRGDRTAFVAHLREALYAGMIITYAQGMALLHRASGAYTYGLDLETVARIWRGGCIIRAALLEDIRTAYRQKPDLPNLLLDATMGKTVLDRQADMRTVVQAASQLALPAPALMAALGYFDAYRSAWLPANLIQAQRDYFGAHRYERVDTKGTFHTQWQAE